ncbi:hypothetical protein [Actinoplanes regularis]|uniref:hypothetical protein n=1 Tax=Actinoplanes regularis TaxID=52697 RepID=UPI0025579762|nr:hypothetical protein [Actinoplanes regularis]
MPERTPAPTIRPYGSMLLIVDTDAGTDLPQLPSDPQVTTVFVDLTSPPEIPLLRALLNPALAPGCGAVRLVLPGAGAPGPDGWCLARRLAQSLGLPVIAPDGPVVALPDMLFVAGGTWWTFRPGAAPHAEGPRHPAPAWQRTLARPLPAEPALRVTPIPAGLWLHAGDEATAPDDPAFAVPVHPAMVTLVIGRPGDEALDARAVTRYVKQLAPTVGEEITLIPYGPDGRIVDDLAARLPGDDLSAVHVDAGMPGVQSDGVRVRTVVDGAGRPAWRPPAQRLRYQPGAAPRLLEWRAPLPDRTTVSVGAQRIAENWLVEAVRCGLWVRRDHENDDAVRRVPADPDRLLLVVGSPSAPPPPEVWPGVRWLLDSLHAQELERTRLVLPVGTPQPFGFPPAWSLSPDANVLAVPLAEAPEPERGEHARAPGGSS